MGGLTFDFGHLIVFVTVGPLFALSFVALYTRLDKFLPKSTSIIIVGGVAAIALYLMG